MNGLAASTIARALLYGLSAASTPTERAPSAHLDFVLLENLRPAARGGVVELRAPGPSMIRVPGGSFQMGSTEQDLLLAQVECGQEPRAHLCSVEMFDDELPQRTVSLSPYWLDRREVTVSEYARCVAAGRCRAVPYAEGARRFQSPDYPVSLVAWTDARDYCAFRGARLPTEAEWERAAGGLGGRRYPWGDLYNDRLSNHGKLSYDPTDDVDGYRELAPVGTFPAGRTPDGFLDLAGNVAEWVHDRYLPRYLEDDLNDPKGPSAEVAGATRVVRGGGYETARPWLRTAARTGADPSTRMPSIGFRCARSDSSD